MPLVNPEQLVALQRNPDCIRNVSSVAWWGKQEELLTPIVDLHISPRCKLTPHVIKAGMILTYNRTMERRLSQMRLLPPTASYPQSSQARSDISILDQMNNCGVSPWSLLLFLCTSLCYDALYQRKHPNRWNTSST